jgi:hypothetical protein
MAILMRVARPGCAAAAVLALTACEFVRSPTAITLTEDRVMVQSVLLAGDSTARALLRLVPATSGPFDPFTVPEWIPIADATVRLVIDGDTIPMTARLDASANPCLTGPVHENSPAGDLLPGCYIGTVPDGIESGGTYDLIVDLPARGRVHGRTLVPGAPVILAPAAGTRIEVAATVPGTAPTFTVEWVESSASRDAELGVASRDEECTAHIMDGSGFPGFGFLPVSGQTSAELSVLLQCTGPIQSDVPGDIVLTTFDSVYSRYARAVRENHRMIDAVAGFTGPAIGVFGSAASARQPVTFVPN